MAKHFFLCALGLHLIANCAWSQENEKLRLVLDAGGHTSRVTKALFTADSKEVITISSDKTIRLWDVATGTPLRTLRPPIGSRRTGMLIASALDPAGKLLAVAGTQSITGDFPVYLIRLEDGHLVHVLRGHENNILSLAFDAQGTRLASGSSGADKSIRIWQVASGECLQTLKGHAGAISGLAFSPRNVLASASLDKSARIWDLDTGKTLHLLDGHSAAVRAIAWSPDGKSLVTGCEDKILRQWRSDGTLAQASKPLGKIRFCQFLTNQTVLLAFSARPGHAAIMDLSNWKVQAKCRHEHGVETASVSPDGRLVVSVDSLNDMVIWESANGKEVSRMIGKGLPTLAAGWSADGAQLAWGNTDQGDMRKASYPLERTFSLDTLEFSDPPDAKFGGRNVSLGNASLSFEGENTVYYNRGQQKVNLKIPSTAAWCGTLLPNGYAAIGSSDSAVHVFEVPSGIRLQSFGGHSGGVTAVAGSPDGRYLLSSSLDQTIRVWSLDAIEEGKFGVKINYQKLTITGLTPGFPAHDDGRLRVGDQLIGITKEDGTYQIFADVPFPDRNGALLSGKAGTTAKLKIIPMGKTEAVEYSLVRKASKILRTEPLVSLFVAGNEWIAWTEEGYYAASAGGEHLMGWHVNNGPDKMAKYYSAAQFHKSLYRPDVIKLLLKTGSLERALELADKASGKKSQITVVADVLPPFVLTTAPDKAKIDVTEPTVAVRFIAKPAGKHPIISVRLMVNGRPYPGTDGLKKFDAPRTAEVRDSWIVRLSPGVNTIAVLAESAVSKALSDPIEVTLSKARSAVREPDEKEKKLELPNLYVLAIGVSEYPQEAMKLKYAAKDAKVLSKTFQATSHSLYRNIEVKVLTDKDATRRNILQGLTWLRKEMTQRDVAIVSFAGHGSQDADGKLYLLPVDADKDDLLSTAVPGEQIKSVLAGIPGRVIVLLDACHSGAVDGEKRRAAASLTDDLVRDLVTDDYGVIVMCSSMGKEFSLESATVEHGFFTLALVEGLSGKADYNKTGVVYLNGLDLYVTTRVKELSKGKQHPVTTRPTSIRSFPLSRPEKKTSGLIPGPIIPGLTSDRRLPDFMAEYAYLHHGANRLAAGPAIGRKMP